jgi:hypothetical protein
MGIDWSTRWLGLTSSPVITGVDDCERFRRCGELRANRETMGSLLVHTPPRNGHRSYLRRAPPRRPTPANTWKFATIYDIMREGALKMHQLTVNLSGCSAVSISAGDKHKFANSGEHLRRGTTKFASLRPSLLDSFNTHGPGSMAELQDYSMVTGVASIADERARPELGFWWSVHRGRTGAGREENWGGSSLSTGQCFL